MAAPEQVVEFQKMLDAAREEAKNAKEQAAAAVLQGQQQAAVQNANMQMMGELITLMKQRESREATATVGSKRQSLIDSKGLGRPTVYDGTVEVKAIPWLKKVKNFFVGVYPEMRLPMEWAAENLKELTKEMVDAAYGIHAEMEDEIDDLEYKTTQLYMALENLTDREPLDIVQNSPEGNGLEAWRRLQKRYDPATRGRRKNLLKSLLKPGKYKLEQLGEAMEKWEEQVNRYEKMKDSKGNRSQLPDDLKIAILEDMVPEVLETHLLLQADRIDTYKECRKEVSSYVEAKIGLRIKEAGVSDALRTRQPMGPDDMDCSSFQKGKPGGGKGSPKFQGTCNACGKQGH